MVLVKQGRFTYDEDVYGTVLLFQIKSHNRKGYSGSDRLKKSTKEITYYLQYCFNGQIHDGGRFDSIDNALVHAKRVCRGLVWYDDDDREQAKVYKHFVPVKKGKADILRNWRFKWKLNYKQKIAIQRLVELGADVYANDWLADEFRAIIPFDLHPDVYVEFGYLFAKLGFEDFPYDYCPIADLYSRTELFSGNEETCAVSARDSVPDGLRYYVAPKPQRRKKVLFSILYFIFVTCDNLICKLRKG